MSENPISRQPMEPLSVGNVVSAGLRLYRDRFKSYFGVAIRATLWGLLPFLAFIPIPLVLLYGQANPGTISILIVLGLVLFFYGTAKFTANSAVISRLAFVELMNQPESVREARSHVDSKFWIFFRTYLLIILLSFAGIIGFYLASLILGILAGIIVSSVQGNIAAVVISALIGILIFAVFLIVLIRLSIRLSLYEIPLAIEEDLNAIGTISRSWRLTLGHAGRIFTILTVAFLVSIPIYIIVQIAASIIQAILQRALSVESTSVPFQILSLLMGYILGLLGGIVLLPFWQAIKGVIYYDLRSRREGLGLGIRDSV